MTQCYLAWPNLCYCYYMLSFIQILEDNLIFLEKEQGQIRGLICMLFLLNMSSLNSRIIWSTKPWLLVFSVILFSKTWYTHSCINMTKQAGIDLYDIWEENLSFTKHWRLHDTFFTTCIYFTTSQHIYKQLVHQIENMHLPPFYLGSDNNLHCNSLYMYLDSLPANEANNGILLTNLLWG